MKVPHHSTWVDSSANGIEVSGLPTIDREAADGAAVSRYTDVLVGACWERGSVLDTCGGSRGVFAR